MSDQITKEDSTEDSTEDSKSKDSKPKKVNKINSTKINGIKLNGIKTGIFAVYDKSKKLGSGQFGDVWLGRRGSKTVAIKKYAKISHIDIPYQVLREISLLKLINHPNIVHIHDIWIENTEVAIIMEFGGVSLRSYCQQTPKAARIAQLAVITRQILLSCDFLHRMGIMHRDLKPDNLLVLSDDDNMTVKLCDFGLAKKLNPFQPHKHSCQIGTLPYRAPELFATGVNNYSVSVDVWSIGCVLFEFVTAEILFSGKTDHLVLNSILSKIPTTEADLEVLGLGSRRIDCCNTEKYYKLPLLYDLSTRDPSVKKLLEQFKELIQQMLVLNPTGRITLDTALRSPIFIEFGLNNGRRLNKKTNEFRIRHSLCIHPDLRGTWTDYIIAAYRTHRVDQQTILVAINIFDRFIGTSGTDISDLGLTAICSIVLASKYIDIKPLRLQSFESDRYSMNGLIKHERIVLNVIGCELYQTTLIDFYQEYMETGFIAKANGALPEAHWKATLVFISNYRNLENKTEVQTKEAYLHHLWN